jgi:hypothetical protein
MVLELRKSTSALAGGGVEKTSWARNCEWFPK